MIIRNNMTPKDVQKQVNSMSKFKRGFNQTPDNINNNFGNLSSKDKSNNMPDMDLNKRVQALKNISRLNK